MQMGLFKRKPAEEEPKVEAPVLRDGDGWRVCVHYGDMMFDKGEIPYAVDFWTEAVDRFDGSDKAFGSMCQGIADRVVGCCWRESRGGSVCPVNLVARIESEIEVKWPEISKEGSITQKVFDGLMAKMGSCDTVEHVVMIFMDACFCQIGYMGNAPEIREVPVRCGDIIARSADADAAIDMLADPKDRRGMNPRSAHRSILLFREYFSDLRNGVEIALGGKTQKEIDDAVAYWEGHRRERVDHLARGVEEKSQYASATAFGRKQHGRACYIEIADFVEEYFSMDGNVPSR